MARQTSLIKVTGKLGGVSFYTSGGQDLARMATGPTKAQIETDISFQRTRENNTEFGGSAHVAKAMRTAFSSVLRTFGGTRVAAQLTAVFKRINVTATGTRGKRPIKLSTAKSQLRDFEFNSKTPFSSIFSAPFTFTATTGRNSVTFDIPAFTPYDYLDIPSGATHFRIVAAIGVVSDYVFDTLTQKYQPSQPLQDTKSGSISYTALPVDADTGAISLTTTVTGVTTVNAACSAVVTLGVEFLQQVGTSYVTLAQNNAMKVVEVL
jgi:hypothetical protein